MLVYKNITLNGVTGILTGAFAAFNIALGVILSLLGYIRPLPAYYWVFLVLLIIVTSFFLVRFLIQTFVFRKIKLIYKMINKSKKSLRSTGYLEGGTIDSVTDDVVAWANKKESEIAQLNELENYRKNFVGNISHELKTPIFSMQGYLHTLLEGGIHDDQINVKYLKRAAVNLDRLEAIVDDLEMINQLESGRVDLNITSFDIKLLAKEVMKDMQFLAAKEKVEIKFKNGAAQNFIVEADQEQIRQVFNNLIANSIKYSNGGGMTKVAFYDVDEGILIEVSDNGIGIESEHLNHLFDRFYRVDAGRGRKVGGSGLGLAIVKHIIEAHNQTITARSTEGEGSTFGFTLKKSKK